MIYIYDIIYEIYIYMRYIYEIYIYVIYMIIYGNMIYFMMANDISRERNNIFRSNEVISRERNSSYPIPMHPRWRMRFRGNEITYFVRKK